MCTYTYDNRIATYNGQPVEYDNDGDMTRGPLNGSMATYTWDARGRLTSAGDASYTYDAEGNRISVTENGSRTSYLIDPNAPLSRVLTKTDASDSRTWYIYGLGLIGQEENGAYRTYHYDLRGSTVALTDENGAVTDRFWYGPYGELVHRTGTTETPFLYNGRDGVMTDANGLYYMRARYYNPEIRRFVNRDMTVGNIDEGQSLNRYAYVIGNPVRFIDPAGEDWVDVGLGVAASVAGAAVLVTTGPALTIATAVTFGVTLVSIGYTEIRYWQHKITEEQRWASHGLTALGAIPGAFGTVGKGLSLAITKTTTTYTFIRTAAETIDPSISKPKVKLQR